MVSPVLPPIENAPAGAKPLDTRLVRQEIEEAQHEQMIKMSTTSPTWQVHLCVGVH